MDNNHHSEHPSRRSFDGIVRKPGWAKVQTPPNSAPGTKQADKHVARTTDGIIRRPSKPTSNIQNVHQNITKRSLNIPAHKPEQHSPKQTIEAPSSTPKKKANNLSVKNILIYIGIIVLAMVIGTALSDVRIGQFIVIASGIVVLIIRADSRLIFGTALFFLIMIPILSVVNQKGISENYALYAFIFLVFGTIRAVIEASANKQEKP